MIQARFLSDPFRGPAADFHRCCRGYRSVTLAPARRAALAARIVGHLRRSSRASEEEAPAEDPSFHGAHAVTGPGVLHGLDSGF